MLRCSEAHLKVLHWRRPLYKHDQHTYLLLFFFFYSKQPSIAERLLLCGGRSGRWYATLSGLMSPFYRRLNVVSFHPMPLCPVVSPFVCITSCLTHLPKLKVLSPLKWPPFLGHDFLLSFCPQRGLWNKDILLVLTLGPALGS